MNLNLYEIFVWVTRASLYAVAVTAVIVLAQTLTRRALSAKWIYALWMVLLLRLVIPAGLESKWSFWNLTPRQEQSASPAPAFIISDGLAAFVPEDAGSGNFSLRRAPQTYLPVIWLAGALSLMCCIIIGNLRLWNTVRRLPFAADPALSELFEECRRLMRVQTKAGLILTDRVKSPILFGFIKPRVLLPADLARELPLEQLRYILLHELAHLKRFDILTGWLLAFLQSLHWFNPMIWWAFGRIRFDCELACDEQALSCVPNDERRYYGDVLIGMLDRYNHVHRLPAIAGILENKNQLKRRLVMIKKFKRPARREIVVAATLFAVLSVAFLTEPRSLLSQSGVNVYQSEVKNNTVPEAAKPVRMSGEVLSDAVIHRVHPVYPASARAEAISGEVILDVTIDEEGIVTEVVALSGPDELIAAAIDAVRQWRYRPTLVNGAPVSVKGEIRANFTMSSQQGAAFLRGTITDASGAVLPGATVFLTNDDTGVTTRTTSNNGGIYAFPSIQPGTYTLAVAAPGFMRATLTDIILRSGGQSLVNVTMTFAGSQDAAFPPENSFDETGDIRYPQALVNPKPAYTQEARDAGISGTVVLNVLIRKDGKVDNIRVAQGLGYGLDEAAARIVSTEWFFRPATRDGEPIDHPATIEVSFAVL
ncbi:MAG: TonB family protein [Acidobacteriota bacterium]|jgi:TonB family protein|nr:TonB family protein [Acidobacteriota bacterium]